MNEKIDYQKVLDSYEIKYRKGSPKEVDESLENMDMIFESLFVIHDFTNQNCNIK